MKYTRSLEVRNGKIVIVTRDQRGRFKDTVALSKFDVEAESVDAGRSSYTYR